MAPEQEVPPRGAAQRDQSALRPSRQVARARESAAASLLGAGIAATPAPAHLDEMFHDLWLGRIFDCAYGALAPPKPSRHERGDTHPDATWRAQTFEGLRTLFARAPGDLETVRLRQQVARDLGRDDLAAVLRAFQAAMAAMRESMRRADRSTGRIEAQAWWLEAVQAYCDALDALQSGLDAARPRADLLLRLRGELARHRAGAGFAELARDAARLRRDLGSLRYAVRIDGDQVTVLRDPLQSDFSAQVAGTFARFRQGEVRDFRMRVADKAWMNQVESAIGERVARLYPELFERIEAFCRRHADFADARWLRLDRELPFYLLWWDFLHGLRERGAASCLPELSGESGDMAATDARDLALAVQDAGPHSPWVGNDFALRADERLVVVTGPNHGGKTSFARMFGQLHHIAALGLPVAAARARLALADRVLTHFERAEDLSTRRGKLQDDLLRMRAIVEQAGAHSVVVLNEVFSSTSLDDAVWLGRRMMDRLRASGCRCVFVTFLDELARFDARTVSLVAQVDPADPTVRSYKLLRRPADGKAHARALAARYRLSREWLLRRIAP